MKFDSFVAQKAPVACEGILHAVGMSGAVIFGVAVGYAGISPFAAFGAMIAMRITPRHGASARIIGALAGCLFLLAAAALSEGMARYPLLALLFIFILSWLAALPNKSLSYLGFVAKCAVVAGLLSYFDFEPSLAMGVSFCSGILWGILLSLANTAFEHEDQQTALEEARALLHGGMNNPYLCLIIPVTVVASSMIAKVFSYSNPAWVGLTVVFLANSENTFELGLISKRIIGTMAGAFISYALLYHIHSPLQLALVVGLLAFLMPFSVRRYGLFSMLITAMVLILIDIAMLGHGGDIRLIFWRCLDTVFGCICILAAHLALKVIYKITGK